MDLKKIDNFLQTLMEQGGSVNVSVLISVALVSFILSSVRALFSYFSGNRENIIDVKEYFDKIAYAVGISIFGSMFIGGKHENATPLIFILVIVSPVIGDMAYVTLNSLYSKWKDKVGIGENLPDKEKIDKGITKEGNKKEDEVPKIEDIRTKEDLKLTVDLLGMEDYTNTNIENPDLESLIDIAIIYGYISPRQLDNALDTKLFKDDLDVEEFLKKTILNPSDLEEIRQIRMIIKIRGTLITMEELNRLSVESMDSLSLRNKNNGGGENEDKKF